MHKGHMQLVRRIEAFINLNANKVASMDATEKRAFEKVARLHAQMCDLLTVNQPDFQQHVKLRDEAVMEIDNVTVYQNAIKKPVTT